MSSEGEDLFVHSLRALASPAISVGWSHLLLALWATTRFAQGAVQDNLPLWMLSLADARETPLALGVVAPLPFSQGFRASQPLSPFLGMSAVYCQLSSAPEQAEQNPDPTLRKKASGQIASCLAKITDVEDNLFLLDDPSLLDRICENLYKDSLLCPRFLHRRKRHRTMKLFKRFAGFFLNFAVSSSGLFWPLHINLGQFPATLQQTGAAGNSAGIGLLMAS